MTTPELWGGPECTVNRIADRFGDQSRLTGHDTRLDDLDRFASLGLAKIRYPVLWELISPDDPEIFHWDRIDARLERLRALDIGVIAGLVHHGSGPQHTNLLDPGFATGLARFAGAVAERYDWITDWTPVNEPLTTARFSALYGHWYPHARDEDAFWLAVLNQVDGVRLAMQAVRRVNAHARLIQTDDLGHAYSTPRMAEQAQFDNRRRWFAWDLLFGRVTPHHPLWERLARIGLGDRLRAIADDPCPPQVVGVNHYLTSDRFLDHRPHLYPAHHRGGSDTQAYADLEAIRVLDPAPAGLAGALTEAWERYGTPLALTEVHVGCTREDQLRWAAQAWDTATTLSARGVAIEGVCAWALLGSSGWNTLLTAPGVYEPGVFDVSTGTPRATALADLWRALPVSGDRHPVVAGPGWWQRPMRLIYPAIHQPVPAPVVAVPHVADAAPVLICGATGTLGQALVRACDHRAIAAHPTTRAELDLGDEASIAAALDRHQPWAVINAAGWVRVDEAEGDADACHRANATGAALLARLCDSRGIATVNFSSDLVFDGDTDRPYREDDTPAPLGVYGASKAAMEAACTALSGRHLIVRTAAFFSPHDPHNFAAAVVRTLAGGRHFRAAADTHVSPSFVPQLVDAVLDLVIDGERGIRHLANDTAVSWAEFARRIARACGLDETLVQAVPGETLGWTAPRPRFAALTTERGASLGSLDTAIAEFAAGMEAPVRSRSIAA